MPPHKSPNIIKYCVITSTSALVLIVISLIPISKQSLYWNSCFKQTINWINEKEKDLSDWDETAKQSLAVSVCNGAVYEPRVKLK
mgnify:CR=1 FL=1|tara:strand:+ start:191 stop:445 length:255 start_codon:yes stop_codon:yes gene_type:complete